MAGAHQHLTDLGECVRHIYLVKLELSSKSPLIKQNGNQVLPYLEKSILLLMLNHSLPLNILSDTKLLQSLFMSE